MALRSAQEPAASSREPSPEGKKWMCSAAAWMFSVWCALPYRRYWPDPGSCTATPHSSPATNSVWNLPASSSPSDGRVWLGCTSAAHRMPAAGAAITWPLPPPRPPLPLPLPLRLLLPLPASLPRAAAMASASAPSANPSTASHDRDAAVPMAASAAASPLSGHCPSGCSVCITNMPRGVRQPRRSARGTEASDPTESRKRSHCACSTATWASERSSSSL
mmetsp:Transcript_10220/g.32369  ORF Transcript_10220/g.32369 Transcript_10220/m.32369 type:complete len:220 (-) Transcript_10220:481-1140(-)